MALRSDTMSFNDTGQSSEQWHLGRRVLLLLLLALALALGLVLLFRLRTPVPVVLFNLFADASMGLLVGLGTRFVLRHRNWFVQGIASAALSVVGLAVLGALTNWKTGIGPVQAGLVQVHWLDWAHIALRLPLQFGRSQMDLLDLAHMLVAIDTSWLALRAWKLGPRLVEQPASMQPRPASRAQPIVVPPMPAPSRTPAIPVRVPTRTSGASMVKRRGIGRALIATGGAAVRGGRAGAKRWGSLRRKPAVQLAVYEEHRCPYCLENVSRKDPRGSVECPICHTLHHKDCWDITGTCQVPHLND